MSVNYKTRQHTLSGLIIHGEDKFSQAEEPEP